MDATQGEHSYEEFNPIANWVYGEEFDTLLINLPGFTRERVKVQIDSYRNLRTTGERPIEGNRWQRFWKDFVLPVGYNTNEIRAKFENETLHIKVPKNRPRDTTTIVTTAADNPKPSSVQPATAAMRAATPPEMRAATPPAIATKPSTVRKQTSKVSKDEAKKDREEKDPVSKFLDNAKDGSANKSSGEKKPEESQKPAPAEPAITPIVSTVGRQTSEAASDEAKKDGDKNGREEKEAVGKGSGEEVEKKQWLGGVVMEMRKPTQMLLLNVVVAVMVLMGIVAYATYKLRTGVTNEDESG
ncbi:uncharacterized protein [Typha angustifolia]|uniref:uncharacterized protein n=1 Tax=Typha angustifolia TaxID=59011 RepID=UPI003C2E35AC